MYLDKGDVIAALISPGSLSRIFRVEKIRALSLVDDGAGARKIQGGR